MANAPSGAVIIIANTATVSTVLPHASHIDNGTPPIAAWTVALGVYACIQNTLSFSFSLVPAIHKATPAILKINGPNIIPVNNIPISHGSFTLRHTQPADIPINIISAILFNITILFSK